MTNRHTQAARILICAILLAPLAGCSKPQPPPFPRPVAIRLQIHWHADSPRGRAIRAILDSFQQQHPDITVQLLGGSGDDRKLLTQITGGNPPDVIETAYRNVQTLAAAGVLRPLTELAPDRPAFHQPLWKLGLHNRTLYGYPWFGHTIQLVYNQRLFQQAGITAPPATWEELYTTARKLTRDTNRDGKPDHFGLSLVGKQHPDVTWLFTMFLHQAGGQLVEQRDGKWRVALNSPAGLKALRFYLKLIRETCPPGAGNKMGGDVMKDFAAGIAAMEFQGPWGITEIWKLAPPARFPVAAAEAPAGPAGKAAELGANMTVIPKTTKHPQAALKLIRYLGSRPAQALLMQGEKTPVGFVPFRVPVRTDLDDLPVFKQHPEFLPFIHGFAWPSIEVPIPQWLRVRDEIYAPELNRAVLGLVTPAQALQNIERHGNRILDE